MNRNTEAHFHKLPQAQIPRSKFKRDFNHKTTFNAGKIIPIYLDEILPGDTLSLDISGIVRMATPIFPVMDDCFLDIYFFFVPNRLTWEHWQEMNGENNTTYWQQPTEYSTPQITAPTGGWAANTIADYMGLPTKVANISVTALPMRAYCKIYNDWFRDENLVQPANMPIDDKTVTGSNGSDPVLDAVLGGAPLNAAKIHDYFTSALPEPQKGPDIMLPLGGTAPVIPVAGMKNWESGWPATQVVNNATGSEASDSYGEYLAHSNAGLVGQGTAGVVIGSKNVAFNNLAANLSEASAATINQLRKAFAVQHLYEADARGGTRYIEILKQHFGVTSPDARLQRSEYLGGTQIQINMETVVQTSSTDTTSPQGNTAAVSSTGFSKSLFTKSFVEHGYILGLAVIRNALTYQQGINKMWSRTDRLSYYWPELANIGEQPILNKEIYAQGTAQDDEVFGYQEAYAELRYKPSMVSGEMRSNYAQSLDAWHYAEDYESLPTLSSDWIKATEKNIERTLAVTTQNANQFIADFYFRNEWTRPLPLYSIPGLTKL